MDLSLKPFVGPKRQKPVCNECGSDDVMFDAYAVWNVEAQAFEVSSTFDKGGCCNVCNGEARFDWIEVTNEESTS